MSSPHFCSLRNQSMAIALSLLLLLSFCCWYSCSFSFTLLVLVLPTSFPFIFSKIKQLIEAGSMEKPPPKVKLGPNVSAEDVSTAEEKKAIQEEGDEVQMNNRLVSSLKCPSPENNKLENLGGLDPSASSDCSISDDESLIEITLDEGPNAVLHQELRGGFRQDFSPELVFRQHGLMELLSEINEEDNMIEIDIAMGSIKCSRFEIKA